MEFAISGASLGILLSVFGLFMLLVLASLWKLGKGNGVGGSLQASLFEQQVLAQLVQLSEAQAQQRFMAEELGRQIRLLNQDMESRQAGQSSQIQQMVAQARTESQQAAHSLQQVIVSQFTQGSQVQSDKLNQFADSLHRTNVLIQDQLTQIRAAVEQKLKDIQEDNAGKLELMRKTVDEKLHATLESRLGESFKQVSERLEQVHKGLGEMQNLATGVGDLKRVLTNVKTRGTWGEVQLLALLEQMLTPSQFGRNIKPVPGSGNIVEFAVRLPGQEEDRPVWLPIDAKFPKEQYERLLECFDRADAEGVSVASKALEIAIRTEAKSIAEKYLAPPHTTDFAILFLPTEGLYAEVVKRPGLVDDLQRLHRVTVAGPITLATLLNALQLGFKTLAMEKRSSEVWTVLSAVKTEFGKFGDILAKTRDTLEKAAKNIEGAETRSRVMQRKLKGVDELPENAALALLGLTDPTASLMDDDESPANS
ncbi:MAG TPA: DNA recombination protein RmuC [Limnobacter sp.]|nr:DNA recombination protein RmuC [Limnobacter sp.]